ncbi:MULTISPECIES: YafY family protein [unclassified Leifsonia]|uniref:helix-turn-helix transcriptional regulator n=1 Tax=unclassified Leifsonia TaxID=2663824 RepID=UPI0008A7D62C|nr:MULTISPECIES: YafY family protein [unclassified Leifsonia]SEI17648.1 Predicted DNA-binding transcriptional regulator YafY, contains an HTH and WYL domains [Leifsonia sp. CL154]SFM10629.1 Predicted DNA-binding transcriptional regulator YafY, contains an HTH and WYL domains [Leifsonia sp. CL147]
MASTGSRALQLLSLLQTHRYWPGHELADRLGISPRTLRRDVERLRDLGYPVDATRGVAGGYQLAAGASLPPLVVDDDEAVALAVGLRTAAQSGISGVDEASVRALAKIVQVMPPRLRRRVDALRMTTLSTTLGPAPSADAGILTALAQACRDEERIEFAYVARDGQASTRTVEPHRLVSIERRWYLVAYDLTRFDWRSFRLDRIASPRPTGTRFRPRVLPAEDAAAYVRQSLHSVVEPVVVEAVVEAPLERVLDVLQRWADVEDQGDGSSRVRITADSAEWALFGLAAVDAPFRILGPNEALIAAADWGERFTRSAAALVIDREAAARVTVPS